MKPDAAAREADSRGCEDPSCARGSSARCRPSWSRAWSRGSSCSARVPAGSTHFLAKPVEPSLLLQVVRAELAQRDEPTIARRILVVDDEVLNRKLTTVRLECAGYEVETAASGQEALAVARRHRPDAILSDVMMPGMDGFTLCREVRSDPRLAGGASAVFRVRAPRSL